MNEWMVSGYTSQWKTLKYNLPQFFFLNSLCVCIVQTEVGSFGIYCVKIFQYELSRLLCCWWRCFLSSQNKSTPFNFGFPFQYVRSLEVITTILIATKKKLTDQKSTILRPLDNWSHRKNYCPHKLERETVVYRESQLTGAEIQEQITAEASTIVGK